LSCFSFVAATVAFAQDWPQWRGVNRDGKAAEFTAPKTWPKELTQKWKVTVGVGDAGPALVGGKLFVFSREGTSEVTRCLDAATGKEIWQDKYDAPAVSGADSQHPGPRGTPTVVNGKVLTLGIGGTVSCLDAATGKKLWRKDDFPGAVPRFHTGTSPIAVDGLCIVQLGREADGGVVAYDLATGEQKWKWTGTGDGPAYGSPVLLTVEGTKMIVTITAKSIIAVGTADGKLLWQAPFAASGMAYNATTPIVDGQTVIYCGQNRGAKAVKLEKQGESYSAKELWSNTERSPQFNTPVLKDGFLYGLTQGGEIFCINAQSGQNAWSVPSAGGAAPAAAPGGGGMGGRRGRGGGMGGRGGGGMGGTAGYGSIVDAGSVLMALTPASQLIVFQPDSKAYNEVARIKVADSATYACPVPAGNRVFVKDQNSVTLWSIE
jgi:outer membrane protein assembly factor BamB